MKKNRAERREKSSRKSDKPKPAGRLVAVEGTRGRELQEAAGKIADLCNRGQPGGAFSRWDASNTFFELRLGKARHLVVPTRTLILLYASDLLFRLRWEIRPAMKEGRTVVAAPYVQTAIGFGLAAGLPQDWLEELFSFAPRADASFCVKEKRKNKENGNRAKARGSFVDFCCARISAVSADKAPALRNAILAYFDDLEAHGEIARVGKKLPKRLVRKGLTS